MQPDDEAPLTLSKWPFYLGDFLLVVTALAIAVLGEWQLSDMQVISCVVSVALGAAIFGLPFVVEYLMRVREEQDDRSSELHLLKAHLQKAESALRQCHERLNELESGSGSVDQRCELLASTVDQKLHTSAQGLTTLSQQVGSLELFKAEQVDALAALQAQVEALSAAPQTPEGPAEELVAVQTELAALQTRLTQAVEPLVAIESRLGTVEEDVKAAAAAEHQAAKAAKTAEAEDPRPTRAPRQRRKQADSSLLHRAIKVKQDSASTAVNRIIDSKSKLVEPTPEFKVEPEPKVAPEPEAQPEVKVAPEIEATAEAETEADKNNAVEALEVSEAPELVVELDPAEASAGMETLPEDFEVSLGADLIEDDELLEAAALDASTTAEVEEESETAEAAEAVMPEAVTEASADLFGEAAPARSQRARTKANDAVLTVSILIGIGNKPFLRGSGGGLSWETGVPMDFEEIGKWRWVAPADLEEPVEVQVYRNDEDADRKGRYTLEPGQKLEVSPVF